MPFIMNTCANCGASIKVTKTNSNEYKCPYCDSRFTLLSDDVYDDEAELENNGGASSRKSKQRVPAGCFTKHLSSNDTLQNIVSHICNTMEEYPTSESLVPYIMQFLDGKGEAATATSKVKDYNKVLKKLSPILYPGEELILYKTGAIFGINKLKTGMFVTNCRVGYADGSGIYFVEYPKLDEFMIEIGYEKATWWYPNKQRKIFLTALGVADSEFAAILAYIILRTNECTGPDHKIKLSMR